MIDNTQAIHHMIKKRWLKVQWNQNLFQFYLKLRTAEDKKKLALLSAQRICNTEPCKEERSRIVMMLCCYCYVMLYQCYWPAMLLACGRRWHQVEWIFVRRQSVLQAIQERYYVVWKHFCLSVAVPPFLFLVVPPPSINPPSLVLSGHARHCRVALEPANTK